MKKVIVLGGGVAGMSAAHELITRGFAVEVYERHHRYCGGKARSVDVKGTDEITPGKFLPGEHGFRFFPGFYKHVTDTMQRTPVQHADGSWGTAFDNLTPTNRVMIARYGKQPIDTIVNFPESIADLKAALSAFHANTGLTAEEKTFFAERIWQLMTSCYDRRANDYERLSWWDYLQADRFSDNYRSLLVQGLTRTLVAANARYASTKTGGDIFLQLIFNMMSPGTHTDRVLNAPTNDAWLNPWLAYLQEQGVQYHMHCSAEEILMKNGSISGVVISNHNEQSTNTVQADYYIMAVPIERAARLMNAEVLKADPTLKGSIALAKSVAWMNGIQFYLNNVVDLDHGHAIYSDSNWAITSISQLQFWGSYDIADRGNGKVRTVFSVDISDWDNTGLVHGAAKNCSHQQIKEEVWEQLKKSLNVEGKTVLRDDMIEYWHIDGDIKEATPERETDSEPLLVNTINSWGLRPEAYTAIPNLFLASDYVRTYTDLATMEGANEAARRAVNSILEAAGSNADSCAIWNLHEPGILAGLRRHDQERYDKGLPWQHYEPWWMKILLAIMRFIKGLFGHAKSS